ncbi:MAG TPA: deaminase [Verrucomicrobiae bacterium]|nr:deaminase [Verrucomicrobiae bacterium]
MYNEELAYSVLEVLDEQFPDLLHFKDLRGRLPAFASVTDQQWLKALNALLRNGSIDGVPLREGSGLADLANVRITPKGKSELQHRPAITPPQKTVNQSDDRKFAQMAVAQARMSISESVDPPNPKVGAVVVKDGKVLATAHRGEFPKCHAEFVALEKKLEQESLVGATVYTTLEPCTSRGRDKIPCAERLVGRQVARVVMGILDPDERVHGRGQMRLRKAKIATDFFPPDLMSEIEELNRDFIRHRELNAKQSRTTESPIEITFDPQNPSQRFWSMESVIDGNGQWTGKAVWEYRVEIKNASSQTLRDVLVTREHLGLMAIRPTEVVFDRTRKNYCDINPGTSELVKVIGWPIPINSPGTLSGESALEYGPIKIVASAADVLPAIKYFEFDYQKTPMLRETISASALERTAPLKRSQSPTGKLHFVPDRHNYGWARDDRRTDVRAGGTFTYDGEDSLMIVDVFVKELTTRETLIQPLDGPGWLITKGLTFRPRDPLRLVFNLINDPVTAERGKLMRFQLVFRDVYNHTYELDPVDFPWIGSPVSVAPPAPSRVMWESLSNRFSGIDAKPLPVWARWIYAIETKDWQWWVEHSSNIAVKMTIELCKEGGKMLRAQPEFRSKFPDVASINDDGDRWLVAVQKVAGLGTGHLTETSIDHGVETHSEGGEIRDLPRASQVLCQMAVNGFSD